MKTSELTGAALDGAVAHCVEWSKKFPIFVDGTPASKGNYSTNWALGGAIIERGQIEIFIRDEKWFAYSSLSTPEDFYGETPLIAAMRCYVASWLGNEVDIPKEKT